MKKLLSGNEAYARGAWEAGATVVSGYPGTPSTEILENVAKYYKDDIYCEWSPNEKVAFEVAAGASLAGARSMVTMKHVGLNVAADPMMTLAYTGTVGGFVILVADDPGMNSSQNEQDTRQFARFAKIPVFEASDSAEAIATMKYAYDISEQFGTPVIVRSTTTVSHSRGVTEPGERKKDIKKVEFQRNPGRFVPVPAIARRLRVELEGRLGKMQEEASRSPLNTITWGDKKLGIITSSASAHYVHEVFPEASVLKLGWSFPFPDALIREFAAGVEQVLVVEELEDFLEEHIKALGIACIGKTWPGGDLVPKFGELNVDILKQVRAKLEGVEPSSQKTTSYSLPELPARPPVLCPGCPHRGVFYALGKFDVIVTGDIGCYSLGAAPPLSRMDTIICMGGGISAAHGMYCAKNERKVVGVLGDSTFFHSGMTGLLDIAYNKGGSVIIVLDNRITAMTGHQDNPGTGKTITGDSTVAVSIAEIGHAVGIKNIVEINPRQIDSMIATLKQALDSNEPWLIISKMPCPLAERKMPGKPLAIDTEKCRKCGLCLKLGCPAIEKDKAGNMSVNPLLCAGCALCEQVCPFQAYYQPEEKK